MAEQYHCPVYFTREMRDILEHPEAYRMPCLTPNAIRSGRPMERWRARSSGTSSNSLIPTFRGRPSITAGWLLPGMVTTSIFFVGDSFTPTGMDDYCLLNRNFFPPEKGFLDCLRDIRKLKGDYLLINQHVGPGVPFLTGPGRPHDRYVPPPA